MNRIAIIGAGQLGSRHLQALRAIDTPLEIHVVEPSATSSQVARERYEATPSAAAHRIHFYADPESAGPLDLAIVATNSNVRRAVVEKLLDACGARMLVLEKLLFTQHADYGAVEGRLASAGAQAWVNCPMRVMPPYERIRESLGVGPIHYRVIGSQYGLVTNAIHYLDHVVHLTGCEEFVVDTAGLDKAPIASKRPGFLELTGTLLARFSDGSRCEVTCLPTGTLPVVVEISNDRHRFIVRESEGKLWQSSLDSKWAWEERDARIPYQSEMTTGVVKQLIAGGRCPLTPYATSARTHLQLLEPLLAFVRGTDPKVSGYPFT